jgi:hypothetical protein
LRNRDNWQTQSGAKAEKAENNFLTAFSSEFTLPHNADSGFVVEAKPKEFRNIYESVQLSQEVLAGIYDPRKDDPNKKWIHGIIPDYALRNTNTGKTWYCLILYRYRYFGIAESTQTGYTVSYSKLFFRHQ